MKCTKEIAEVDSADLAFGGSREETVKYDMGFGNKGLSQQLGRNGNNTLLSSTLWAFCSMGNFEAVSI